MCPGRAPEWAGIPSSQSSSFSSPNLGFRFISFYFLSFFFQFLFCFCTLVQSRHFDCDLNPALKGTYLIPCTRASVDAAVQMGNRSGLHCPGSSDQSWRGGRKKKGKGGIKQILAAFKRTTTKRNTGEGFLFSLPQQLCGMPVLNCRVRCWLSSTAALRKMK